MSDSELMRGLTASQEHIERMADKIYALTMAQQDAERQVFFRLYVLYSDGVIDADRLLDINLMWAAQHCYDGWEMRWLDAGLPGEEELTTLFLEGLRYRQNEPYGWAGDWRRASDQTPMPRRGQSVVYVLYDDRNQPCYVGSTGDLTARLKAHRKDGKKFVYWTAYPCVDRTEAYRLEDRLLKGEMPYLNKRRGA